MLTKNIFGNCHAKGTLILMADGSTKHIEDVHVGDFVMGGDSTPQPVIFTCNKQDKIVTINPSQGTPYSVNPNHMLSLKNKQGDVINMSVTQYMKQLPQFRIEHFGYYNPILRYHNNSQITEREAYVMGKNTILDGEFIPANIKFASIECRKNWLVGLLETCGVLEEYLNTSCVNLCKNTYCISLCNNIPCISLYLFECVCDTLQNCSCASFITFIRGLGLGVKFTKLQCEPTFRIFGNDMATLKWTNDWKDVFKQQSSLCGEERLSTLSISTHENTRGIVYGIMLDNFTGLYMLADGTVTHDVSFPIF